MGKPRKDLPMVGVAGFEFEYHHIFQPATAPQVSICVYIPLYRVVVNSIFTAQRENIRETFHLFTALMNCSILAALSRFICSVTWA